MVRKRKILLISTGGTIAGNSNMNLNRISNYKEVINPSIHLIERETNTSITIDSLAICNLDSSNILPTHWKSISNLIKEKYENYDAFLITHGTNTLGYTSAALSFAFENLRKPIILTGSQVPYGYPASDALTNIENGLRVAVSDFKKPFIGVSVVFGSHIITGVRAKKTTEFDYDAFQTFTSSSLGRIGREIKLNINNVNKHLSYFKNNTVYKNIIVNNNFETAIASLTEFPGMHPDLFKSLVESSGIKGFIFRSFGAGDVSNNLQNGLEYLRKNQIPIVVTTQAPNGVSNFKVNQPGQKLKENDLAIPAWDMSIEAQTTKLSWLLGQKKEYEEIKQLMITDLRGEISINN